MKFQNPLPVSVPKECQRAAKIFNSFVDRGNNGLDGVIPRSVLENASGFAIFTVMKAGFVLSARGGSGIVIARLPSGKWSAPSAIGTAGFGLGTQAGAEITDFLVVLNSRSAVKSFMSAGSLTLGGNASIAVGPLGRNGEATASVNTSGKLAAMYSYSKTRGLFGGVSIEGSVIMERQDANALAYEDDVTAQMLLGGMVLAPSWALGLIGTLEACTGMPKHSTWIEDTPSGGATPKDEYAFGLPSPSRSPSFGKKKPGSPLQQLGSSRRKKPESYFDSDFGDDFAGRSSPAVSVSSSSQKKSNNGLGFDTHFESDFTDSEPPKDTQRSSAVTGRLIDFDDNNIPCPSPFSSPSNQSGSSPWNSHSRSTSMFTTTQSPDTYNPFVSPSGSSSHKRSFSYSPATHINLKPELTRPLSAEGVARGIALYNFDAVEPGDLSFRKGAVITITAKTETSDDWWTGKVDGRVGIFPANFVSVV